MAENGQLGGQRPISGVLPASRLAVERGRIGSCAGPDLAWTPTARAAALSGSRARVGIPRTARPPGADAGDKPRSCFGRLQEKPRQFNTDERCRTAGRIDDNRNGSERWRQLPTSSRRDREETAAHLGRVSTECPPDPLRSAPRSAPTPYTGPHSVPRRSLPIRSSVFTSVRRGDRRDRDPFVI